MQRSPITLHGIDHVVLRVRDTVAALDFYRDVLGCVVERVEEDIGLYQLRAGASLIDLVPVDSHLGRRFDAPPGPGAPNMDHFCLQVDPWDADTIRAWLGRHGIDAGEVEERYGARGFGPSLYVLDPDGNTVELKGPPYSDDDRAV